MSQSARCHMCHKVIEWKALFNHQRECPERPALRNRAEALASIEAAAAHFRATHPNFGK